jgi:hypothetical protein
MRIVREVLGAHRNPSRLNRPRVAKGIRII